MITIVILLKYKLFILVENILLEDGFFITQKIFSTEMVLLLYETVNIVAHD